MAGPEKMFSRTETESLGSETFDLAPDLTQHGLLKPRSEFWGPKLLLRDPKQAFQVSNTVLAPKIKFRDLQNVGF